MNRMRIVLADDHTLIRAGIRSLLESIAGTEVVAETGRATLESRSPFGAAVTLSASRSGTSVIVRTNFHPAWRARSRDHDVALVNRDGQLSFDSPCDGDCVVTLQYPKRHGLLPVAIVAILAGGFGLRRFPSRSS